jgi:transcriptional regulator with XRE-family HTH domain
MSLREPTLPAAEGDAFAALLRRFRAARRMSQLELALSCEISARHLSFLETGRAKPSREMVLQIAEGLVLPLGSQNALLQAAGFAAVFPASPLETGTRPGRPSSRIVTGACAAPMPQPHCCWRPCRPKAKQVSSVC